MLGRKYLFGKVRHTFGNFNKQIEKYTPKTNELFVQVVLGVYFFRDFLSQPLGISSSLSRRQLYRRPLCISNLLFYLVNFFFREIGFSSHLVVKSIYKVTV